MISRRDFLQSGAVAAGGVVLGGAPVLGETRAPGTQLPPAIDYYDKLGVPKIINAAGTYTYLTASLMPPEVIAAVALAANNNVRLRDLQKASGEYIAKRLQCEAALVSAG